MHGSQIRPGPGEWARAGRGRSVEFRNLLADDIVEIIRSLPTAFAPYLLLAVEPVKSGGEYVPRIDVVAPEAIDEFVARDIWNFFILSEVLSPTMANNLTGHGGASLSLNGAINLQFGRKTRAGLEPTALGHVGEVASYSGEHVRFPEYSSVYEAAVKTARRLDKGRS